jgi:hypothetical protein
MDASKIAHDATPTVAAAIGAYGQVLLRQTGKLITGGAPALAAAEKEERETKAQPGNGGA